jgi:hypothetical protein
LIDGPVDKLSGGFIDRSIDESLDGSIKECANGATAIDTAGDAANPEAAAEEASAPGRERASGRGSAAFAPRPAGLAAEGDPTADEATSFDPADFDPTGAEPGDDAKGRDSSLAAGEPPAESITRPLSGAAEASGCAAAGAEARPPERSPTASIPARIDSAWPDSAWPADSGGVGTTERLPTADPGANPDSASETDCGRRPAPTDAWAVFSEKEERGEALAAESSVRLASSAPPKSCVAALGREPEWPARAKAEAAASAVPADANNPKDPDDPNDPIPLVPNDPAMGRLSDCRGRGESRSMTRNKADSGGEIGKSSEGSRFRPSAQAQRPGPAPGLTSRFSVRA